MTQTYVDSGLVSHAYTNNHQSDQGISTMVNHDDNPVEAFLKTSSFVEIKKPSNPLVRLLSQTLLQGPSRRLFTSKTPFQQQIENLEHLSSQLKSKEDLYSDILNKLKEYTNNLILSHNAKKSFMIDYIYMLVGTSAYILAFVLSVSAGVTIICAWLAYSIKSALPEGVSLDAATSGIMTIFAVLAVWLVYMKRLLHAKMMDMEHRDEVEKIRELVKAFQLAKLGETLRDGKKEE